MKKHFINSAKRISSGKNNLCCNALSTFSLAALEFFKNLYEKDALDKLSHNLMWFGDVNEQNQNARILAILFAAEFYEDETR